MSEIIALLGSGLFWTIIGAVATVAGAAATIIRRRDRKLLKAPDPPPVPELAATAQMPPAVEEIDSQSLWVEAQVKAIHASQRTVSLCLHTIHASGDNWKAEQVNAALSDAASRGIEIRVLAASDPEKLRGAYDMEQRLDIDVRFSAEIRHYDLRFVLADADLAVIGVADPDREQGKYRPSYSWAVLRSSSLCEALERDFQRMWLSQISIPCMRHCSDIVKRTGALPSARIAADLGLEYETAKQLALQQPISSLLGDATLILVGKSFSGKSTSMRMLTRRYGARCLDLRDLMLPYVHRYGSEHIDSILSQQVYAELMAHCRSGIYDAVEIEPDFERSHFPQIFESVESGKRKPVLVRFNLTAKNAISRSTKCGKVISAKSILRQSELDENANYRDVCEAHNVPIIEIEADGADTSECFGQLLQGLNPEVTTR